MASRVSSFAAPAPLGSVRAGDLQHLDALGAQVPVQAGAVAAGALYPDAFELSESAHPGCQFPVAGLGGGE